MPKYLVEIPIAFTYKAVVEAGGPELALNEIKLKLANPEYFYLEYDDWDFYSSIQTYGPKRDLEEIVEETDREVTE